MIFSDWHDYASFGDDLAIKLNHEKIQSQFVGSPLLWGVFAGRR
jgi:hypothetical protein